MKKIKMYQIVPDGFGASIGVNAFFGSRQNRFWGPFAGIFGFRILFIWGFSDVV